MLQNVLNRYESYLNNDLVHELYIFIVIFCLV